MIRLQLEQGSAQWLDKRRCSITSTDASIIMGVNPYKTRKDLLKQKLGLLEEQEENEAMRLGRELEPKARDIYMLRENCIVFPEVCIHDKFFWAMASLDGISESGQHIIEIKCGKNAFEKATKGEIPNYYLAQMQHALFVTDLKVCHYFCFWEGKHVLLIVNRDDDYIAKLTEEEEKFYEEMLFTDPKELMEQESQDRRIEEAIKRYESHKAMIESHEVLKEQARLEIIDLCEGRDTKAFGYKISKSLVKGRIKYDCIPELAKVDLEKYRAPSTENWSIKKLK